MPFVETLWNQSTPIERAYPYLTRDAQCEVAVVGGGVAGALCAWSLRQAGHEVALLTRSAIGYGATSASSGILRFDHEEGVQELIRRVGPQDAIEVHRARQAAVAGLERIIGSRAEACGFLRRPALTYAADKQEAARLQGDFTLLSRAGFNVAWLDRGSAAIHFSFPVEGAILFHAGAAEVDPYRLTRLLAQDGVQSGMRIFEYSEVTSLMPLPSGVLLKTSLGISLRAKAVVLATGEPPLSLRPHMSSWRTYSLSTLSTASMQGWGMRALIRRAGEDLHLRTVSDALFACGRSAPVLSRAQGPSSRRKRDILRYAWLEDAAKTMFPLMSSGLSPAYRFSAVAARTSDGLPVIGPSEENPGVYSVSGYGLDGAVAGVIAGRMLAGWLKGEQPALARLFSQERL